MAARPIGVGILLLFIVAVTLCAPVAENPDDITEETGSNGEDAVETAIESPGEVRAPTAPSMPSMPDVAGSQMYMGMFQMMGMPMSGGVGAGSMPSMPAMPGGG